MRTRIRLAEVLAKETDNLDLAEDIVAKGVRPHPNWSNVDFTNTKGARHLLQS
jgi:hypothetical protein